MEMLEIMNLGKSDFFQFFISVTKKLNKLKTQCANH